MLVRLPWLFLVPVAEAPDEATHLWVISFLRDHLRLPSAIEVEQGGALAVYGSLPQFGYLPQVLTALLFSGAGPVLAARLGSLLAGVITVAAATRLGGEVFADRRLSLALPAIVIFHPQLVFVHSYANTDSTVGAIAGVLTVLTVLAVKSGPTPGRCVWLGLLSGWLILSKYSGASIVPVTFLAVAYAGFAHRAGVMKTAACLAITAGVAGLISVWWFVRNAAEFGGDALGTRTMYRTWATSYKRQLTYYLEPWKILVDRRWWRFSFFSYWGLFGYMTKFLWRPVYLVYVAFVVLAVGGWAGGAARAIKERDRSGAAAPFVVLALTVAANLSAMILSSAQNLGGPQGRYLFASELAVAALIVAGLSRLGRFGGAFVAAFVVLNVLTCLGAWVWLARLYGFPAPL